MKLAAMVTYFGASPGITNIAAGALAVVLALAGVAFSSRVRITVDDSGVRFRNLFRSRSYAWNDLSAVTIKRWGARITAADEVAATLPIGLGTYGRKHGIAFELADGTLSPTSAATAWVGANSRQILLDALDTHATARGVTVRIINPNNGGLFGVGWDIRIGDGIPRPRKTRL
ncbi:PH domain-containing protein [Amycolatopsis sp. DSM 110486]|uniref:PH domain-containing protein n=1 Tax=Amycolatopsis sp. DSM 110486 TaxID=2865832 RepID=UPI001C6A6CBF|nr:PH domain-containing protein [Amycolatopsis sp. DSM 110486]QYN22480.1 PH domain-containing protein [Amycolatopsis sp. DSM 110486]